MSKFTSSLQVKSTETSNDEHFLTVIATDASTDRDGEKYDTESLLLPLKDGSTVRVDQLKGDEMLDIQAFLNHERDVAKSLIGSVSSASLTADKKLEMVIRLSSIEEAQRVYTLANEGHLGNNISVTFDMSAADMFEDKFVGATVLEVSVVWRGSNKNARVLAVKSDKDEGENMPEIETKTPEEVAAALSQAQEALSRASEAISAATAANSGDGDDVVDGQGDGAPVVEGSAKEAEGKTTETQEEVEKEKEEEVEVQKSIAAKQVQSTEKAVDTPKAISSVKSHVNEAAVKAKLFQYAKLKSNRDRYGADQIAKSLFGDSATKSFLSEKAGDPNRFNYPDADDAGLLVETFIDKDIERAAEGMGGLWSIITTKTVNSSSYRRVISEGDGMLSVAGFGSKTVDHPVKAKGVPTFRKFEVNAHPWAHIYIYDDEAAEDTFANLYDEMVQELAERLVRRQDNLVLSYAGQTSGAEVYEATGILANASTPTAAIKYDSTFAGKLSAAVGKAKYATSNRTLVANVNTIGKIGSITDTTGRPLYSGENNKLSLGLLGSLDIKIVDNTVLADDKIVVGDFKKYTGIDRGAMKISTADQYAAGVDLFGTDATAVRGVSRLGGGQRFAEAFVAITGSAGV